MIIDELFESPQQCPECGGISFSDLILAEKKDACYHKVKASAKVWPSAYASGRLVQCRKKGAANYGNKSEGVAEGFWGDFKTSMKKSGEVQAFYVVPKFLDSQITGLIKHTDPDPNLWNMLKKDIADLPNDVQLAVGELVEEVDLEISHWPRRFLGGSANTDIQRTKNLIAILRKIKNIVELNDPSNKKQGVTEGQLESNTPDPVVVVQDLKGNILDKINLSVAAQKYKLGQPQNIKNQLAHQNYTKVGNYTIVSPMSGQPQDATTQGVAETELDEKSVSQAQFRTMAGAAHNPEFARKVGISQDVAKEFNQADKKSNYKKLPARATEGEQQKGADYRDPREVDYDDEYDAMVARVKKLAGLGAMKTVYDPARRQYRNMPTAQQPKK